MSWIRANVLVLVLASLRATYFAAAGYNYAARIPETGLFRSVIDFTCGVVAARLAASVQALGQDVACSQRILLGPALVLAIATTLAAMVGVKLVPAGATALLLLCLVWHRHNPFASAQVVWLGDISYSVYMTHYLIFILVKMVFNASSSELSASAVMVYCFGVLDLSALLFRSVERPAQRRTFALLARRIERVRFANPPAS